MIDIELGGSCFANNNLQICVLEGGALENYKYCLKYFFLPSPEVLHRNSCMCMDISQIEVVGFIDGV